MGIETLSGKPGCVIPLDGLVRASTTTQNIKTIRIGHGDRLEVRFTLGYWERKRIDELTDALMGHGIVVSQNGDDTGSAPVS